MVSSRKKLKKDWREKMINLHQIHQKRSQSNLQDEKIIQEKDDIYK